MNPACLPFHITSVRCDIMTLDEALWLPASGDFRILSRSCVSVYSIFSHSMWVSCSLVSCFLFSECVEFVLDPVVNRIIYSFIYLFGVCYIFLFILTNPSYFNLSIHECSAELNKSRKAGVKWLVYIFSFSKQWTSDSWWGFLFLFHHRTKD